MRIQRIIGLAIGLAFCSFTKVLSLYNGNPSLPEMPEEGWLISKESWLDLKIGYEGDIVFDRCMHVHASHDNDVHNINSYQSTMNSGTFTFGFSNRVELYFLLGSYQVELSQRLHNENHIHYDTDHHLGGLAGVRAIVGYWGETRLGLDAKYFMSTPDLAHLKLNGHHVPSDSAKMTDLEWQVGASLSHKVSFFIPYIGIKYSSAEIKLSHLHSLESALGTNHLRLKNKYPVGFVFGFGLSADRALAANLEARILDETAATLAVDFRF